MVKKWVWFFIIFILLFLATFCYILYMIWGGKFYLEARKSINNLPLDKKAVSENIFDSNDDYRYSGIFMGTFNVWHKGVWVWGTGGPRFFQSDQYTVYSYLQMCTAKNLQNLTRGEAITPERSIETDVGLWNKKVKVGDFIAIQLATPEHGGNLGRLRESLAYDWWIFNSAIPIDKQCKN